MDKQAGPLREISLATAEISPTGMKISPSKHSQVGWPGCRDDSSKKLCEKPFKTAMSIIRTKLSRQAG
jgi:hypothetical protein